MPYKPKRPYELGSDEHVYELNKTNDAKWRSAYTVGICLKQKTCWGYPDECGGCVRFCNHKEKKEKRKCR